MPYCPKVCVTGRIAGGLTEAALCICHDAAAVGQDSTYLQCARPTGRLHGDKCRAPQPTFPMPYQTVALSGPCTPSGTLVVAAVTGGPATATPGTLLGTDDFGH